MRPSNNSTKRGYEQHGKEFPSVGSVGDQRPWSQAAENPCYVAAGENVVVNGGFEAGGFYPQGLRGTNEWTHLVAHSGRVPPDCTYRVGVYLRQGCTGTAWFDDLTVRRVAM